MATKVWQGGAQATPQVSKATPATVTVADVYTLTINGKDISYTAVDTSVATVIAAFIALINASTIPEWIDITASDGTTYLIMTGKDDGEPFTVTSSVVGTGTLTVALLTSPTGPYHWDNTENWDTGTLPVDADDIVYEKSSWDCRWGLAQGSVTPASITIKQSYTGKIGLKPYHGTGTTGYWEYRDLYLALGNVGDAQTITIRIGEGDGIGSGRIMLDTADAQTDITVVNTGQAEGDVPAVLWVGTHAANVVRVYQGSFGCAVYAGESCVIEDLDVGAIAQSAANPEVVLGSDSDVDDIRQIGGTLIVGGISADAVETLVISAGTCTVNGTDGVDSLKVRGGRCYYNSTGTLGGAPTVSGSGVLDFSQDMKAKTVTNPIEVYGDEADVIDPLGVVSSLIIDYNETTRIENLGRNIRITRGTPA